MCAGVQNESRPMERCQEMSQCTPTIAEVIANAQSQMYQGAFMEMFLLSYFYTCARQRIPLPPHKPCARQNAAPPFDDPMGRFRVCYLGTTIKACFAETFRITARTADRN